MRKRPELKCVHCGISSSRVRLTNYGTIEHKKHYYTGNYCQKCYDKISQIRPLIPSHDKQATQLFINRFLGGKNASKR